jgi:hypothetical protein
MISGEDPLARSRAFARALADSNLPRCEKRFEQGDKGALIEAIAHCALAEIPLPSWARSSLIQAWADVTAYKYGSWDDVFGIPHELHKKLRAARQKKALAWPAWLRITDLRRDRPHSDHFPEVAKEFKISEALCKKYFYRCEKTFASMDANERVSWEEIIRNTPRYALSK